MLRSGSNSASNSVSNSGSTSVLSVSSVRAVFSLLTPVVLTAALGCSEYGLSGQHHPAVAPESEVVPPVVADPPDAPPDDPATGAIHGRVCEPDAEGWVVGASVSVDTADGPIATTTDADGWFTLEDVPPGSYEIVVKKGSFVTAVAAEVRPGETTELQSGETCLEQGELEIAVVAGTYDHIQDILDELGLTYDLIARADTLDLLRDPAALGAYDLVFFNCGASDSWLQHEDEVAGNLEAFVSDGGSVYASDLAYYLVEAAFPAPIEFEGNDNQAYAAAVGKPDTVDATVVDPAMQLALGSADAEIDFELGGWAAMTSVGANVDVLLEGTYRYGAGDRQDGPLAVRFAHGAGTVAFTSFHNESQVNVDVSQLLNEIVLSL